MKTPAPSMKLATQTSAHYFFFKRWLDIVLASVLFMTVLPLVILVLIFRKNFNQPCFTDDRFVGANGAIFPCVSLNIERAGWCGNLVKIAGLSTAPRLLSIIRGHLSFVGPYPWNTSKRQTANTIFAHAAVKPGLICLWWLRCRSNVDFGTEVESDLEYVQNRSLRGDVAIMLRALVVLLYGAPADGHAASQLISGIRFLNLSMDELLSAILIALDQRVTTRIAFVNPDCVNIAARDAHYRECLNNTEWICADGIGMKIAGRLLGRQIRQNINGTDLFPRLCEALQGKPHSIYLLGAQDGVADLVAGWMNGRFPRLSVAGSHSGFFSEEDEADVIASIRASGADVLLVAMGAPRQEKWLQLHLAETGAIVGLGVGGLFDFYSGRIPRAPMWLREVGGEWIYRFWQEPKRMWRRYLIGNGTFLLRILKEKMAALSDKGACL